MTPDYLPLLGPTAHTDRLWIAEAIWVTRAGCAAAELAKQITGRPSADAPAELHPDRFADQDPAELRQQALRLYRDI